MPQDSGMKTTRQMQDEAEARSAKAFHEAAQALKKTPRTKRKTSRRR